MIKLAYMLPFLTLRKHIELNVYTPHAAVQKANPVKVRSKSSYMKNNTGGEGINSVSGCYGFIQMHRRSAILHSWMDWSLLMHDNGELSSMQKLQGSLGLENHTQNMSLARLKSKDVCVTKVTSPLRAECKEAIDFVFSAPPFLLQGLSMPSGITDFKDQHDLSFFLYLDTSTPKRWDFNLGDQMLALTAMSDRPVKINSLYDKEHFEKLVESSAPLSERCSYVKRKRANKEFRYD